LRAAVFSRISQQLLTLLQLTRMALVFTAIADASCTLLLSARRATPPGESMLLHLQPDRIVLAALISVGLYGFGMSLNDIIDRRRDSQLAPGRPLPSGRLDLYTAYGICAALALLALVCGSLFVRRGGLEGDMMSIVLVVGTALLISFYDIAGKYLVAPGLLALGLIRFFHALIPDPSIPLLWHPLLLLNHVTILSTVAYVWEEKRPALTKLHLWTVAAGLLAANGLGVLLVVLRRPHDWHARLDITWPLAVPAAAAVAFVLVAWTIKRRAHTSREAGQRTMLFGLLWLIVYDAAFVAAYVRSWIATAAVLLMFPVAYFSVQLMRWWAKLLTLSQRPTFKRAKT
jgi:4-hydroxybenzoate polyprenyltransferase